MKIKTKKQLNLPQLIEWAWDNDVKNEMFIADKQLTNIEFDDTGDFLIYGNGNRKTVKFTVEVEEEITEDREFNELVGLDIGGDYWQYDNVCVYDFNLDRIKAIYIPNDDYTMTLIWRDGKLV